MMIQVDERLELEFPNTARMILQVHDELVFEIAEVDLNAALVCF